MVEELRNKGGPALYRLDNIDIAAFLHGLHILAGDYYRQIEYNFEFMKLQQQGFAIVILDEERIMPYTAKDIYTEGSYPNGEFGRYAADTAAVILRFDPQDENGHFIGNAVTLDANMLLQDVAAHTIAPAEVWGNSFGGLLQVPFSRWQKMSPRQRQGMHLRNLSYVFSDSDEKALHEHLIAFMAARLEEAQAIEPAALFDKLNASYMQQADHPAADMLRVPRKAAKDMVLHMDGPVYDLQPTGPVLLDSVRDACSVKLWTATPPHIFAVKQDDAGRHALAEHNLRNSERVLGNYTSVHKAWDKMHENNSR